MIEELQSIKAGKRTITALHKKNINTVSQLLNFFPKEYYDYRDIVNIEDAPPDYHAAVGGELVDVDKRFGSHWYIVMHVVQANGLKFRVMIFSNTFKYDIYASMLHKQVVVMGKVQNNEYGLSIINPDEVVPVEIAHFGIKPVYRKIAGVSEETFLSLMGNALDRKLEDAIPVEAVKEAGVMTYDEAIRALHHPKTPEDIVNGRKRILFNDLYYLNGMLQLNSVNKRDTAIRFTHCDVKDEFVSLLPFDLTEDQKKVVDEMYDNARQGIRNNILLQGDVGCGKTVVAISLMMLAYSNGYQSVIMAPRSVLARQHYEEIKGYADQLSIPCAFLGSETKGREKEKILKGIKDGSIPFIVGTHSVLSDAVEYHNLGAVITDEEHLFGVNQKKQLENKALDGVHQLSMSATPIPRTLATVLYGDAKEIFVIKSKPAGRLPIITEQKPSHNDVFSFIESEIKKGNRAYVVCPAILDKESTDIVSIEEVANDYYSYFNSRGIRVGVVHGKKKPEENAETIDEFKNGTVQLLISTTVIEVGVNVPEATVMVIEQADRFGLASLHQLRGRVGRSSRQSYCFLISERETERLEVMCQTNDGFEIAEADLRQRGAGDMIGTEQSGNSRYIDEMLRYPKVYDFTKELVKKYGPPAYDKAAGL